MVVGVGEDGAGGVGDGGEAVFGIVGVGEGAVGEWGGVDVGVLVERVGGVGGDEVVHVVFVVGVVVNHRRIPFLLRRYLLIGYATKSVAPVIIQRSIISYL